MLAVQFFIKYAKADTFRAVWVALIAETTGTTSETFTRVAPTFG